MIAFRRRSAAAVLLALAACGGGADRGISEATQSFDGISPNETVHFTGTEPFWGGSVAGETAIYSTPENPDGTEFAVERFAGNNGLAYSGTMDGMGFDMTITPGACSDGMSDRSYPYTVTLMVGGERREGCAWTDSQPFSGPREP